jgi:electron transfer flavoprotein beta subunit
MRIVVTVTEVTVVGDEVELDGLGPAEATVSHELNEWDAYALEAAVQIAEAHDDVEVVTATVGPERSEEVVRQALAKGADRAVRVWDDAIAEMSPLDPAVKARLLGGVVADEDPDLVLGGVQSGDAALGATGVTLSAQQDMAWAAVVNDLELADEGVAAVHRELEGGLEELTDVDLPAVFTIQTGINEPRYASLRGIRQAQSKPLEVEDLAGIGLDAGGLDLPLELTDLYEPEAEGEATIWEGGPEETAGELAELLREKGVEA